MKTKPEFYDELKSLLPLVPEAFKHLHKVTGKLGLGDIHPLDEKRWSEECWKSWGVLISVMGMIQWGKTRQELDEEVLKQINPCDFIGQSKTGKFDAGEDERTFDKITNALPDLNGAWEKPK